jgi:hypothetical protein
MRSDGGKSFAALLDIHINFLLVYCDIHSALGTWSALFSRGQHVGSSVLESEEAFLGKMDIHRYNSSFVFRYRALWDKVMGFFILFFAPARYEEFVGAKSRRQAFKKISADISSFPADFAEQLDEILTKFDGKFRTPEIHGTGPLENGPLRWIHYLRIRPASLSVTGMA